MANPTYFITVSSGRAILRNLSGPVATFGTDVASAIIQGEQIVVTQNNGTTQIYQFSQTGRGVIGPVRTIR